ncbi:MAG TPA: GNAT family N-acetyltransferase [Acidobacteriaceae bacterium]|jgi:predicted GNAT superfamily acetyltransferase|nr:GNAT family N-acetyltransferase [Acidobacteriaceae bacterium]
MNSNPVLIRPCVGFEEFSACVQLQIEVWGYGDRDVVPRRMFIVGQRIGGQVIGAFDTARPGTNPEGDAGSLIGFAMALPGISRGRPYLHSHMLAVNPEYRNLGIGRRLKLFQRDEAMARGIRRMEWTFDPLEIKNSFLNVAKLGAIVRRYAANFYGVSSSRLHGQVPTDRLYAEWWLDSDWVCSALGGKPVALPTVEDEIAVPHQIAQWRHSPADLKRVLDIQTGNREHFEQAFARQLAVIGFRIDPGGNGIFQLGRWQEPEFPLPEQ